MNVYLVIATHVPEAAHFLKTLTSLEDDPDSTLLFWPDGLACPADLRPQAYAPASVAWRFESDRPGSAFILLDPRCDLLSQIHPLADDLHAAGMEPARVFCLVDMACAEASPGLREWLETAIAFADDVFLGNRSTASKSFVRDFQKSFEKRCYPCRFGLLKGAGRPDQPEACLIPDTRRLSQLFDLPEEPESDLAPLIIDASCDLDVDEEPESASAEDDGAPPLPDVRPFVVLPQ